MVAGRDAWAREFSGLFAPSAGFYLLDRTNSEAWLVVAGPFLTEATARRDARKYPRVPYRDRAIRPGVAQGRNLVFRGPPMWI